jgi:hypothetical protein
MGTMHSLLSLPLDHLLVVPSKNINVTSLVVILHFDHRLSLKYKVVYLYFSLCFTSLFLAILTSVSKYENLPENAHSIKVKNNQKFTELACTHYG